MTSGDQSTAAYKTLSEGTSLTDAALEWIMSQPSNILIKWVPNHSSARYSLDHLYRSVVSKLLTLCTPYRNRIMRGSLGYLFSRSKCDNIDGLVQERRNSIANALELHLSCTDPSICFASTISKAQKCGHSQWLFANQWATRTGR